MNFVASRRKKLLNEITGSAGHRGLRSIPVTSPFDIQIGQAISEPTERDRRDEPHPIDRRNETAAPALRERDRCLAGKSRAFAARIVSVRT